MCLCGRDYLPGVNGLLTLMMRLIQRKALAFNGGINVAAYIRRGGL